jgi:hypothetical protein
MNRNLLDSVFSKNTWATIGAIAQAMHLDEGRLTAPTFIIEHTEKNPAAYVSCPGDFSTTEHVFQAIEREECVQGHARAA